MTYRLDSNARIVARIRKVCAAPQLAKLFADLVRDADASEPAVAVELTTAANDDEGRPVRGSYYSPSRRVIYVLTEIEGEARGCDEILAVLAHELGHVPQQPIPTSADPSTVDRTGREIEAWDAAAKRLVREPAWPLIEPAFSRTRKRRVEEYERAFGPRRS